MEGVGAGVVTVLLVVIVSESAVPPGGGEGAAVGTNMSIGSPIFTPVQSTSVTSFQFGFQDVAIRPVG